MAHLLSGWEADLAYESAAPDQRPSKAMRVFVANADSGTGERVVEVSPDSDFEGGRDSGSPDGTRLVINVGGANPHTLAVVPVDGGGPAVMSDGFYGTNGLYMVWAPDGQSVLAWRDFPMAAWLRSMRRRGRRPRFPGRPRTGHRGSDSSYDPSVGKSPTDLTPDSPGRLESGIAHSWRPIDRVAPAEVDELR